jgi:deazaflavin-dependent oxidoreductase (nitroreductase family)
VAKKYEVTAGKRVVSAIMGWAARRGLGNFVVLTTRGRKSGEPRQVTVSPITFDGVDYLVSPYGGSGWVLNVRADPHVSLTKGGTTREAELVEVTGSRPEVVQAYYRREAFSRQFMDVPEDPTVDDFAAVAERFPVFEIPG